LKPFKNFHPSHLAIVDKEEMKPYGETHFVMEIKPLIPRLSSRTLSTSTWLTKKLPWILPWRNDSLSWCCETDDVQFETRYGKRNERIREKEKNGIGTL